MKKNKSLFIILLSLIVITAFFIYRSTNTTIKKELSDFAVKDTASITKIFIADRNGHSVTLERKNKKEWLLNGKDEPKSDFLKLFLDGVYKIKVQSRVAKAAYNNVIKALASSGIKCEIYLNDAQTSSKTYYVGSQTEDGLGTFMIIENSNVPFITEIPGFNGYLTPRYSVKTEDWKMPRLFRLQPSDLKSLMVNYSNFPDKSFTITSADGKFKIESPTTKKMIEHVDSVAVDNYLALYKNVFYETQAKDLTDFKKDSMLQYAPSIVVSLTNKAGQTREVDIYPMPYSPSSLPQEDDKSVTPPFDVDRMFGYIKPEKEFVIIQHYTFDKLLRQFVDFDLHRPKQTK